MHCAIAPEEVDGETINDAIYNRNAKVEAKMNYKLKEVNGEYDKMATELDTLVMSGDSTYDAVYMPMFTAGSGLSQGYYRALDEIGTIHLGEEWWHQNSPRRHIYRRLALLRDSRTRHLVGTGTASGAFCSTRI